MATTTGIVSTELSTVTLSASGLTGATSASRYVGATASGAPSSGTFSVGDFIIDQSGAVWINTVAGTPGTWKQIGGTASGIAKIQEVGPLSVAQATIDFTSIPASFRHLKIVGRLASNAALTSTALQCTLNTDVSAHYNYVWTSSKGDGTSNNSGVVGGNFWQFGTVSGANAVGLAASPLDVTIQNYSSATLRQTFTGQGYVNSGVTDSTTTITLYNMGGDLQNAFVVNAVHLALASGSFAIGSVATLYGLM